MLRHRLIRYLVVTSVAALVLSGCTTTDPVGKFDYMSSQQTSNSAPAEQGFSTRSKIASTDSKTNSHSLLKDTRNLGRQFGELSGFAVSCGYHERQVLSLLSDRIRELGNKFGNLDDLIDAAATEMASSISVHRGGVGLHCGQIGQALVILRRPLSL